MSTVIRCVSISLILHHCSNIYYQGHVQLVLLQALRSDDAAPPLVAGCHQLLLR